MHRVVSATMMVELHQVMVVRTLNELLDSVVLDEVDAPIITANSDLLIQCSVLVAATLEVARAYLDARGGPLG